MKTKIPTCPFCNVEPRIGRTTTRNGTVGGFVVYCEGTVGHSLSVEGRGKANTISLWTTMVRAVRRAQKRLSIS